MTDSKTNSSYDSEAERERRIDHLVDTGVMNPSEAREAIEHEDALRRQAEARRAAVPHYERVRSFAHHTVETLTLFDEI